MSSSYAHKHAAALITQTGKIVAMGHNYKPDYFKEDFGGFHAEVAAINKVRRDPIYAGQMHKLTMVVVHLNRVVYNRITGALIVSFSNSLPCKNCAKRIKEAGIKDVIYSDKLCL